MTHSDPIANFLTRVRNASRAGHRYIDLNWSKILEKIAQTFQEGGYVEHILVKRDQPIPVMRVFLRYGRERKSAIHNVQRVSKPGQRRYVGYEQIPPVMSGLGMAVLSTCKGVMSGHRARQEKVGGELLCYIW